MMDDFSQDDIVQMATQCLDELEKRDCDWLKFRVSDSSQNEQTELIKHEHGAQLVRLVHVLMKTKLPSERFVRRLKVCLITLLSDASITLTVLSREQAKDLRAGVSLGHAFDVCLSGKLAIVRALQDVIEIDVDTRLVQTIDAFVTARSDAGPKTAGSELFQEYFEARVQKWGGFRGIELDEEGLGEEDDFEDRKTREEIMCEKLLPIFELFVFSDSALSLETIALIDSIFNVRKQLFTACNSVRLIRDRAELGKLSRLRSGQKELIKALHNYEKASEKEKIETELIELLSSIDRDCNSQDGRDLAFSIRLQDTILALLRRLGEDMDPSS
jgi:hypothetical protein